MKIILSGCNGKMGQVIARTVAERDGCEIVAGLDRVADSTGAFPVFATADIDVPADIIIDFSHPAMLQTVLTLAERRHLPVIIATTGLSDEQLAAVRALSEKVPVFFSANMSIGVNLLSALVEKAARVLGNDFDIEIVEKHHNQKVDAPSGTALMLADAAKAGLSFEPHYVYDRHSVRQKREKTEIGISSVRAGTIVGEHEVIFGGRDEVITLSHLAMSKEIFAVGALNAAAFLVGKPAGLYSMKDMI